MTKCTCGTQDCNKELKAKLHDLWELVEWMAEQDRKTRAKEALDKLHDDKRSPRRGA